MDSAIVWVKRATWRSQPRQDSRPRLYSRWEKRQHAPHHDRRRNQRSAVGEEKGREPKCFRNAIDDSTSADGTGGLTKQTAQGELLICERTNTRLRLRTPAVYLHAGPASPAPRWRRGSLPHPARPKLPSCPATRTACPRNSASASSESGFHSPFCILSGWL
jgi:hypothetical protein